MSSPVSRDFFKPKPGMFKRLCPVCNQYKVQDTNQKPSTKRNGFVGRICYDCFAHEAKLKRDAKAGIPPKPLTVRIPRGNLNDPD